MNKKIVLSLLVIAALSGLVWAGAGKIGLDWSDNTEPDLSHYDVHRSMVAGGPYEKVNTDPVIESEYLDEGLEDETTYFYTVTALDIAGNESEKSEEASATVPDLTAPAAPTGLTIQIVLTVNINP